MGGKWNQRGPSSRILWLITPWGDSAVLLKLHSSHKVICWNHFIPQPPFIQSCLCLSWQTTIIYCFCVLYLDHIVNNHFLWWILYLIKSAHSLIVTQGSWGLSYFHTHILLNKLRMVILHNIQHQSTSTRTFYCYISVEYKCSNQPMFKNKKVSLYL